MGLRLRLRRGYDVSGFNPHARAIAVALKRYGAFIADNGSNWSSSRAPPTSAGPTRHRAAARHPGTAFEVVRSAAPVHAC